MIDSNFDQGLATLQERGTPQLRSISEAEFLQPPQQVLLYKIGDEVTRGNWASFIEQSFSRSLGVATGQYAFFEWHRLNQNFDWETSCLNFRLLAYTEKKWSFLQKDEKELILRVYNAIARHRSVGKAEDLILYSMGSQLSLLSRNKRSFAGPVMESLGNLKGMPAEVLEPKLQAFAQKIRKEVDMEKEEGLS